jgi:hypothetical protein
MRRPIKRVILLIIISGSIFFLYWFKCQLGINIFRHFSWEDHFPVLEALQKRVVVIRPEPGEILVSTFDEPLPYISWLGLWAKRRGSVEDRVVKEGLDGTRGLLIRNASSGEWSFRHSALVEVSPGDEFLFSGFAKAGPGVDAGLEVVLYNFDKKVIRWDFARERVIAADWHLVQRRFTVPENGRYIQFRLSGAGMGDAYFDNIHFIKIAQSGKMSRK